MPPSTPDLTPSSVRTPLLALSCQMCGTPLQGRRTVCSATCRIARSRQKYKAKQAERDAKVRLLLREVLTLLEPEKEPSS